MQTGSQFMVTLLMMAVAAVLAIAAYAWQRGTTPDVERIAGQVWADMSHDAFADCPRENGIRFWMGCTDEAPATRSLR